MFEERIFKEGKAIELMQKGVSLADIAKATGLTLAVLEELLERFEIKIIH